MSDQFAAQEPRLSLANLIARLETAAHGDLELTADVYEALGYLTIRQRKWQGGIAWKKRRPGDRRWFSMGRLTENIDSALGRLPPGWWLESMQDQVDWSVDRAPVTSGCHVSLRVGANCVAVGGARTRPLALCAAILRAHVAISSAAAAA